jgi:outer membrane cobalamin receptor
MHSGAATLAYTGASGLEASITATYVGMRYNRAGQSQPIPAYTRFDLAASYPLNAETRLTGRIENLTNVRYEDPLGYNAAGFSAIIGLSWRR